MHTRLRLLKGATALLYFGPLLAGLGGFGWAVVPLFAAIFMLWLFILRPHQWPRSLGDWARPEALISLLTQGVVQVLLVAISFGIGRGIGGVLGTVPPFPLMLPVAISFLSIPLARMLWDPWKESDLNAHLDDALIMVEEAGAEPVAKDLGERVEAAGRMIAALNDLPADSPADLLASHVMAMSSHVGHDALRVALMDRLYDHSASPMQRRAAVVHGTEPAAVDRLTGTTYPMALFNAISGTDLLQLFASRCSRLVAQKPAWVSECPDVSAVLALAAREPQAAAALKALAADLDQAASLA